MDKREISDARYWWFMVRTLGGKEEIGLEII